MHINNPTYDCIIIGAGMSGLCCASRLAKHGHRVLILEARARIGGRIHTESGPNNEPVDLGASFVHGVDGNPLTQVAKEYGVKLYSGNMNGLSFKSDGTLLDKKLSAKVEENVYNSVFSVAREHARQNLLPPTASLDSYLSAPDSPLYDGLKENEKHYAHKMAQFMDGWTGASLDEISLKYWGFEREFEGMDKVVADGYVHLLEPLRRMIIQHGGQVLLSSFVHSLEYDEDSGLLQIETNSGDTYMAKSGICTIPLGVLKKSPPKFNPPLPARRLDAISKVGFGLLNKAVLVYPSLWWPADAYIMHMFLPSPSAGAEPVNNGPIPGSSNDDSNLPPGLATEALFVQSYYALTKRPMLMFFFGGHNGEALERLSNKQVRDWLHAILKHNFLKLPGAPQPKDVPEPTTTFVTRWRGDELSGGSYSYIPVMSKEQGHDEHASPLHMVELSRPLWEGRLGFAGEHTELDHYASVHGPAISGWREADRVHALLQGPWAELRKE